MFEGPTIRILLLSKISTLDPLILKFPSQTSTRVRCACYDLAQQPLLSRSDAAEVEFFVGCPRSCNTPESKRRDVP